MLSAVGEDIGAILKGGGVARIPEVIVAAAGNDNVEIDGPALQRSTFPECYLSAVAYLFFDSTLADGETLSLAANVQDSGDGAAWADFGSENDFALAVVATGGTGGTIEQGVEQVKVNLRTARDFIRLQSTFDLSAGATDTARVAALFVLGGSNV